ncbi:hypothetical protein Tco_1166833 [Tanacetum coccineum]
MLNKDNYVPWSSPVIQYARSIPNGKMIIDFIENDPYVRRMIATPGEPDLPVPVPETFHEQTDEELTENDIKRMDADDQSIQTILLGLPEDVYATEKKAKLFNEWEKFTSTDGELIKSYYHRFMQLMNDLKRNKHFPENIAANLKFLNNLQSKWKRHVTIVRQTKNLHEADFTQIFDFLKMNQDKVAQPGMNMGQDRQIQNIGGNGGNQFGQYAGKVAQNQQGYNAWQNVGNQVSQNAVRNPGVQNGGNQNGLVVVPGIANQNGTGNIVAARAEAKPRRRDAAYLQTQLLIDQKEEAGIQLQAEEFDLMAAVGDRDEIEEVKVNYILMANLQQSSTSGTQLDKAPVYDIDGSDEVQHNDNCYDNDIFNMFTQEEQYTDLLEPILEPQLVPQNDNNVTSVAPSMVQSGGTVETSSAPNEETHAHQETVYRNLIDQVAQVNMVNRNMRETNAELKSKLARYKTQEQRIEINQEKYDKLEKCYQKSVYQEHCLTRKINALHLSSSKQITTLNDEISNLNKQLLKEKSTISSLMEEKKKLKHDFKTWEDKYLDKEVNLEAKIKELENILFKRDQTVQTMHMLNPKPYSFYHPDEKMALGYRNPLYLKQDQLKHQSLYNGNLLLEKHDPPTVYDSEETLELAQESREKMIFLKKEIKPTNYAKINHLSGVFIPQTTKSKEELFLSNVSNMVTVSKTISIPNKDLSDDTTPSVARKVLNEVKNSLVTLQQAAKFVQDFKSLGKEADESLDKQKSLELEIERLLKASVSHDIMSIVQNSFVDVPSNLQTELDPQLGDLKGKSSITPSASNTLDPLNQKSETKIMELEFQVVNYEREIRHLKTTYKNLFDSITSNQANAKLHNIIYENAKLRDQIFENTSDSMNNTSGTSVTPQVDKPKLSCNTPKMGRSGIGIRERYFIITLHKT